MFNIRNHNAFKLWTKVVSLIPFFKSAIPRSSTRSTWFFSFGSNLFSPHDLITLLFACDICTNSKFRISIRYSKRKWNEPTPIPRHCWLELNHEQDFQLSSILHSIDLKLPELQLLSLLLTSYSPLYSLSSHWHLHLPFFTNKFWNSVPYQTNPRINYKNKNPTRTKNSEVTDWKNNKF